MKEQLWTIVRASHSPPDPVIERLDRAVQDRSQECDKVSQRKNYVEIHSLSFFLSVPLSYCNIPISLIDT